jgi:hypothetical protein
MAINWHSFRESFKNFIVKDLEKALSAHVEVGTIILTIVGIESLSGYFVGKNSDDKTFMAFIGEFMPEYSSHAETLYKCVRNGLAHDYIIKEHKKQGFMFTRDKGEKHLMPVENKYGWFYLNREKFALDFIEAQKVFFEKVETDKEMKVKAMGRLKGRGFLEVFSFYPRSIFVDPTEETDEYNGATGTSVNFQR